MSGVLDALVAVDVPSLVQAAHAAVDVVARALPVASSEGDGTAWLLLSGPAAGGGLYWALYRYYRNTDKTHHFERDTVIESRPVTGSDTKIGRVTGVRNSKLRGQNAQKHRERVQRF